MQGEKPTDTPDALHSVVRAFISQDKTARFTCPACARSKMQDVSSFLDLDREIKATIRCKCGNTFKAVLERRKHHRKQVDLLGTFWIKEKGLACDMVVKDLSRAGIKFHIRVKPPFKVGEKLWVEFRLDNTDRTMILKQVLVRNIKNDYVGCQFIMVDPNNKVDKAIGFYLM